jgi:hypothetical protein
MRWTLACAGLGVRASTLANNTWLRFNQKKTLFPLAPIATSATGHTASHRLFPNLSKLFLLIDNPESCQVKMTLLPPAAMNTALPVASVRRLPAAAFLGAVW